MKKTLLLIALLCSGLGFSQSINDYMYVIVPERFEFLDEENKFNLNTLTKMMFEKYGFTAYHTTDKFPDELALDRCKALYADLANESGLLGTTLVITLKDCNGVTVFASEKGKSKLKSYKQAYYEALREASRSVANLNYKYSGKSTATASAQAQVLPVSQQAAKPVTVTNENALVAQPIANGYQLVDGTPKVVLKIYKTSQQDSYTAVSEEKTGVVFKRGNDWIFEYYQNEKLVSEKLNIKF